MRWALPMTPTTGRFIALDPFLPREAQIMPASQARINIGTRGAAMPFQDNLQQSRQTGAAMPLDPASIFAHLCKHP